MTTKTTQPAARDDRSAEQANGRPPFTARWVFHALIATAAWFLFFYWWGSVVPQIRRSDAVAAVLFIVLSALATAVLTAAWVRYNIGIYRRKGPRRGLPPPVPARDTDLLGRRIVRPDDTSLLAAHVVVVTVEGDLKRIEPGGSP